MRNALMAAAVLMLSGVLLLILIRLVNNAS
jgi:hypothetical protein